MAQGSSSTAVKDRVCDLVGDLDGALVATGSAQRQLLAALAGLDKEHVWERDGHCSMAEWVAAHVGISQWAARRWIAAGHALPLLPHISRAFEAGELCLDKVLELCRFATDATEKDLVKWAQRVTLTTIKERAEVEKKPCLDEVVDAHTNRYVTYYWTEERTKVWLEGSLPADQGAVVIKALDRLAGRLPDIVADDDDGCAQEISFSESLDARRADALVALASMSIADDHDADRSMVVVHADIEALVTNDKAAEIELGGVLHPETVRRLCCDSRLQTVLHDNEGAVVGIGRAGRSVPRWLARGLRHRDRCCTFPGCHRKWLLQAHHIVWWGDGGPTDLDNLTLVCMWHHKLVHEHNWRVKLGPLGTAWYRPSGKRYLPGAKQLELVERAPPEEPAA